MARIISKFYFYGRVTRVCFLLFSTHIQAQNLIEPSFANCASSSEQVKYYEGRVQPASRVSGMHSILQDIKRIHTELKSPNPTQPKALLHPCLRNKTLAFEANIRNAPPQLADDISFNLAAGEYALLVGEYTAAYNFYSQVALRDPNNLEAHQWRYLAWGHMTRLSLSIQKPDRYYEELKYHLNAILNHKRVTNSLREQAHVQLSEAAELMNEKEVSAAHLEQALLVNSQNLKTFSKLSDYYAESAQDSKSTKLYQTYIGKFNSTDKSVAIGYERWARILEKNGQKDIALQILQQAKKRFSQDPEINSMLAKFLAENKRIAEAQDLLAHTSASKANNKHKTDAQTLIEEQKGDEALAQKQTALALNHYNKAIKLDPKRKQVRIKAAQLLYAHHQARNFQEDEALKADMDVAISFLLPLFNISRLSAAEYALLIQIADKAKQTDRTQRTCNQFKANYGRINPNSIQEICIRNTIASDKKAINKDLKFTEKIEDKKGEKAKTKDALKFSDSKAPASTIIEKK